MTTNMPENDLNVLNTYLDADEITDEETLAFWRDFQLVFSSCLQGMTIIGFWMETRMKLVVRKWLPPNWHVSGPSQIYDPKRPELRSRSWDLVVHRKPERPLPPPASQELGYPLLPREIVSAVVDTKTSFSDPAAYSRQSVFNLANDAHEPQLDFLGSDITKIIFAAASPLAAQSLYEAGLRSGLHVISMGRYQAGPVSDGVARKIGWRLESYSDGTCPMQRYKELIEQSVDLTAI